MIKYSVNDPLSKTFIIGIILVKMYSLFLPKLKTSCDLYGRSNAEFI